MNNPALWLLCLLLAPAIARAQVQTIPLPATLNGQEVGELNALVEAHQLRALDVRPIRSRLQQLLAPARFEMIRTNTEPMLSPEILDAAGVQTKFDFQNLIIQLTVSTEARRIQTLDLLGYPNFTAARTVLPSSFSAYMNVRGGFTATESSTGNSRGVSSPQLDFENAFNLHGVVLENETTVNPFPGKSWEKRDTRLVWDQPEKRLRWELGDLEYPVTSFQGFLPMAGFSVHKEDSLQPYRLTTPLGQSAFFLKQDSKVEVIVNGHVIQTLQMNAGPHQIQNFPLTGGANNVVLRITDPVGRVQYINATVFYGPGLLKAGEREFNFAAGFPSETDPRNPVYHYSARPAASAFYRWGLTDRLAAGMNAQATPDTQQAGAETVVNTPAGIIGLETAMSHDRKTDWGHSERLQYEYYVPSHGPLADGVLTMGAQYQSAAFALPTPFAPSALHNELWTVQANYSQRVTEHFTAGFAYSRSWSGHQLQLENYDLIGGYYWRGLRANVTVEHSEGSARQNGWGAFFTVTWTFGHSQSAFASYDTRTRVSREEWQYTGRQTVDNFNATVGLQNTPTDTSGYGSVYFFGRRAELALSQDTLSDSDNLTSVRWGTALVYADGTFGISRPVSDSFALIESTGRLRDDGGIGVQPLGRRFLAQEDWLGPAVLPQLTAYYPVHVNVEPRQPAADFDPKTGDLRLEPTYRSGTFVRLGQISAPNVTAVLCWADGKPAILQAGTLVGSDGRSIEFISNRDGLVYLENLQPGTYHATLVSHPQTTFTVTIPPTKEKDLNLGQIRVPITP